VAKAMNGTVVVVTGASSGIGRATALELARRGASVVLAARSGDALQEVAGHCQQAGGAALAVPTDVRDEAQVAELAARAVDRFGRIDVWVNNAGVYLLGTVEETPPEAYRQVLETNFFGAVHGARAVLPQFRRQGGGVLINVASVYSRVAGPYLSAYVASKHAVRALSESLRQELRGLEGVRVCTVSPSVIDTPLFGHTANYTGRAVKPPPPVYPPELVAKAIVRSALRPRRERIVGNAGRQLNLLRWTAPGLYERVNARFVDSQQFGDRPAPATDGNLMVPMAAEPDPSGGRPGRRRTTVTGRRLTVVGLAAAGSLALVVRARRAAR
jgi:NAD(P)-dependent dehydrogenase (short-subunit alcohol dehydrogenase family)